MSELLGSNELIAKLENMMRKFPQEAARALYEEAQVEKTESMRRTPVEFGVLRASHDVSKPEISANEVSVKITVGGAAAPYAVHVHEDLEARHSVGQAKFLESTVAESRPFFAKRIADRFDMNKVIS
jgi:hypothetical protein